MRTGALRTRPGIRKQADVSGETKFCLPRAPRGVGYKDVLSSPTFFCFLTEIRTTLMRMIPGLGWNRHRRRRRRRRRMGMWL
jgi:hypothetical protein